MHHPEDNQHDVGPPHNSLWVGRGYIWTGWDPKELVRDAMSTDSFFEVWEIFIPGVNI